MEKQAIEIQQLNLQPFTTFEPEGVLLVSGDMAATCFPMLLSLYPGRRVESTSGMVG